MLEDFRVCYSEGTKKTVNHEIIKIDAYLMDEKEDPLIELGIDDAKIDFLLSSVKLKPETKNKAFFLKSDKPVETLIAYDKRKRRHSLLLRFDGNINRRPKLCHCVLTNSSMTKGLRIEILAECSKGKTWKGYLQGASNIYLMKKWMRISDQKDHLHQAPKKKLKIESGLGIIEVQPPKKKQLLKIESSLGIIEVLNKKEKELKIESSLGAIEIPSKKPNTMQPIDTKNNKIIGKKEWRIVNGHSKAALTHMVELLRRFCTQYFDRLLLAKFLYDWHKIPKGYGYYVPKESKIEMTEELRKRAELFDLTLDSQKFERNFDCRVYGFDCEMAKYGDAGKTKVATFALVDDHGAIAFYQLFKESGDHVYDSNNEFTGLPSDTHNHFSQEPAGFIPTIFDIVSNRILVGFGMDQDITLLADCGLSLMSREKNIKIIDLQRFSKFRRPNNTAVNLAQLVREVWGLERGIMHSAVCDARATIFLYNMFREEIQAELFV